MMEAKQPGTIPDKSRMSIMNPTPFWLLMTGTFVDRLGTNWIVLLLAIYVDHFDLPWVWYGCSLFCAISMIGFYGLHLQAKEH